MTVERLTDEENDLENVFLSSNLNPIHFEVPRYILIILTLNCNKTMYSIIICVFHFRIQRRRKIK